MGLGLDIKVCPHDFGFSRLLKDCFIYLTYVVWWMLCMTNWCHTTDKTWQFCLIGHLFRYNNKTVLIRSTKTSRRESEGSGLVDTVLFVSHDVKTTKINQYLSVILMLLNVSNSRFQKLVMFWMWYHGIALWHHSNGAWPNGLFLMTASDINCWTDIANCVARLWQAGEFRMPDHRLAMGCIMV